MSIEAINFTGNRNGQKRNHTVAKTAGAFAFGSALGAGTEYIIEKNMLKNPIKYLDYCARTFNETKENLGGANATKLGTKFLEYSQASIDKVKELIEGGKINWKNIRFAAVRFGTMFAVTYLIAKGIKALVHRNNK